ncbi:MAG: hypothetical protein KDB80_08935 [Planctomycetes bacterium]|nr:hypothetical protein [Planctomycetota bacterium]
MRRLIFTMAAIALATSIPAQTETDRGEAKDAPRAERRAGRLERMPAIRERIRERIDARRDASGRPGKARGDRERVGRGKRMHRVFERRMKLRMLRRWKQAGARRDEFRGQRPGARFDAPSADRLRRGPGQRSPHRVRRFAHPRRDQRRD